MGIFRQFTTMTHVHLGLSSLLWIFTRRSRFHHLFANIFELIETLQIQGSRRMCCRVLMHRFERSPLNSDAHSARSVSCERTGDTRAPALQTARHILHRSNDAVVVLSCGCTFGTTDKG